MFTVPSFILKIYDKFSFPIFLLVFLLAWSKSRLNRWLSYEQKVCNAKFKIFRLQNGIGKTVKFHHESAELIFNLC